MGMPTTTTSSSYGFFSHSMFKLSQYLKMLLMLIIFSKLGELLRPTPNMLFNKSINRDIHDYITKV